MENEIYQKLQLLNENFEQQKLLCKGIMTLGEASRYMGVSKSNLYKKTSLIIREYIEPPFQRKLNQMLK